jgi:Transmembrane protein 26
LQDGPFLCLRLGLIIHYKIISQSNIFFTTKNFLVVLLQLYRVCVIIIEHRNGHRLTQTTNNNEISSANYSSPVLPQKSTTGRKRRTGTTSSTSTGNIRLETNSMANLQVHRITADTDMQYDGNSDPLPRRKRSIVPALVAPPLPPPRPNTFHSKSLTCVLQPNTIVTNHKICTAV